MGAVRRGQVTPELIGQLAALAGLRLSPDRQEALVPFVREFLEGMSRLEAVDLTGCEPPTTVEPPPVEAGT
jgi:Asp-tRNA(Asn)/Glu-tRNA(Gln) amidotransferase C subunit